MSLKTVVYLAVLVAALLVLAIGGWVARGLRVFTGRTVQPRLRPRLGDAAG